MHQRIVISVQVKNGRPSYSARKQHGWWIFWRTKSASASFATLDQLLLTIEKLYASGRKVRASRQQRRAAGREWAKHLAR